MEDRSEGWVIVNTDSGKVLDNANGYCYTRTMSGKTMLISGESRSKSCFISAIMPMCCFPCVKERENGKPKKSFEEKE